MLGFGPELSIGPGIGSWNWPGIGPQFAMYVLHLGMRSGSGSGLYPICDRISDTMIVLRIALRIALRIGYNIIHNIKRLICPTLGIERTLGHTFGFRSKSNTGSNARSNTRSNARSNTRSNTGPNTRSNIGSQITCTFGRILWIYALAWAYAWACLRIPE
jgi:hypothetical protein